MIVRPFPLILFGPLAVWWMILHWRAVRRVEIARALDGLHALARSALEAAEAFVALSAEIIRFMAPIRAEAVRAALDLPPLALYRPTSETLRKAGIPSTLDRDRPVADCAAGVDSLTRGLMLPVADAARATDVTPDRL